MKSIFENYLGKVVDIVIDRPLGSKHPKHNLIYKVNYGYVPNTKAPDGEEIDAYILGIKKPVAKFTGLCVAIVHRLDDNDDKLIIVPEGITFNKKEIADLVQFQEQYYNTKIITK